MNILLTNDDGYEAEGLGFLKDYFDRKGHQVYISAPDREKSGFSHSVTIKDEIRLVKEFETGCVLRGTPADCVFVAVNEIFKNKIDVVVSGINHGRNVGRDIFFSGTIGAARQGAFSGLTSFALSMEITARPLQFDIVDSFLDTHFEKLVNKAAGRNFFYNINFPNISRSELAGVKVTVPSADYSYEQTLERYNSPFQGSYFWVSGTHINYTEDPETDIWAIRNNFISLTPLQLLPDIDRDFSL